MKNRSPDTAMVITGRKRGGPRQLADYLMDKGENEYVHVCEIGCFVAKTIPDALAEMWAVADGCKAKDFLYHVTLNPRPGVTLTEEQWKESVDTLEKKLNLVGHQRVVVEHVKKGRTHRHVAWNRVDPKTGRVKKLSFDKRTLRATALELGDKFGLTATSNKGQSYKRGEIERGKRTGIDPKVVKAEVTALWNRSKSGKEFITNLAKHGYILARGDKSQFVLIDKAGSVHGLTRRIHGATAKTVRRGMADIDIKTLPTIAEVRSWIKASQPKYTPRRKSSAKGKSGTSAHIYIRGGKSGRPTSRKGAATHNRWQPYGFFTTSRRAGSAIKSQTTDKLRKNKTTTTGIANPSAANADNRNHAGAQNAETNRISGGVTPHTTPTGTTFVPAQNIKPHQSDNENASAGDSRAPASLPAKLPPNHFPKPASEGGKEKTPPQYTAPFRPVETGGMCEAQRIDLAAAQAGKISWQEYYRKWGRSNGPAP
jgi:Relaxase/Mobilisation nuclease domain